MGPPVRVDPFAMFQARSRTTNAMLALADICTWAYALTVTLHAVAG